MITHVTIKHIWTHEQKTLEVEIILSEKLISLRWPLAGVYDLDLKKNVIKARSVKARAKHPYCPWIAADIQSLRRQVWEHFNPDHKAREEAYAKHQERLIAIGTKKCPTTSTKSKSSVKRTRL